MAQRRRGGAASQGAPATPAGIEPRGRNTEEVRSPVAWLLLALVVEQPSHGYELAQRYEQRFGTFAAQSVPRIYAALDRLRDAGLIEPITLKPAEPARKQHQMRRSYRATRAGAEAYRTWVAERLQDDPYRAAMLGRIASSGLLGVDAVLEVLDEYERSCMQALKDLPTDAEKVELGRSTLQDLTVSLVVDQQRRELRARHEWAIHARRLLQAHQQASTDAGTQPHDDSA